MGKKYKDDDIKSKKAFQLRAHEKLGVTIKIEDIVLSDEYPYTLKGYVRNRVTKEIVKIVQ